MQKEVISLALTSKKAEELLARYGPNVLPEKKPPSIIARFFAQFENALMLLLVGAGIISIFVGETLDAVFIFLIVILNAGFGLYQEFKAERALASLKQLTVTTVRVLRDGIEIEIDSHKLVPGDIMHLEEGDKIPADAEVLTSLHLETNEAALTGESFSVSKDPTDSEKSAVFMGTTVVKGRGYARVIATGESSRFGKIAKTLGEIEEGKTPLQKKLESFTKQVGIVGILAAVTVFVLSLVKEKTVLESFLFAVSLAVAAVPEGLPAVMTITLALGVERMAKKNAIVRKLNAIETLGSVTVVATDKTGTLTTNKMHVKKIWLSDRVYDVSKPPATTKREMKLLLTNGILCSTATLALTNDGDEAEVIGDPTEGAMLILASHLGLSPIALREEWKVRDELSFNAVTKRMSVVVSKDREKYVFTKGAPESILSICNRILWNGKVEDLSDELRMEIEEDFQTFAKKGQRMIAFSYQREARKPIEENQVFIGFVGIADPLRPEASLAVGKAQEAGIRIVMITGDNELTAEAIGIEAGIIGRGDEVITGGQLESLTDAQIVDFFPKVKVFARTTPDQKYRLVKLYQQQGETVAVTGDGVNDALALKQSDVGVAMGKTGTDVAKETADMIITDDNFASLINAIEEGRHIFSQIKNTIKYLLSCNLGEILYILPAVFLGLPVLNALQILYMNIATDGLPAISLAFTTKDSHTMRRPPRRSLSILELHDFRYLLIIGMATAITGYLAELAINGTESMVSRTTVVFTSIMLVQHFVLVDVWLSHRSVLKNIFSLRHPVFLIAFFLPILVHPFIVYHPFFQSVFQTSALSLGEIGYAVGVALVILFAMEGAKVILHFRRVSTLRSR